MDAFTDIISTAMRLRKPSPYELVVIGLTDKPFTAGSGLIFKPHQTLETVMDLDTLIIPGGGGSRSSETGRIVTEWLKHRVPHIRRIVSICTGLYLLAPTGLLDGHKVTTHWFYSTDVAKRFPKLKVDIDAIFLKSGKFYTSAGITAGIDMALALIEEDLGAEEALMVARNMVVYFKRNGGQRQYSAPLRLQSEENDPFSGLVAWMASNLEKDLSVDVLAERANLSRRHFSRLFRQAFNASPAQVVEGLRLDEARVLLAEPKAVVERVGRSVGFTSPATFRKAFARRFGIPPSRYREPFSAKPHIPTAV